MAHLQHDDFYLVLPSHARSEGAHDNRPQHFKVDLPKELFLEGAWEVGVTELLYTHTFYESPRFTLTGNDRTLSFSNGARLGGTIHMITIAEEQYPGYYDLFEHVFDAMAASFEGFSTVVQMIRSPEQFRWVLQPLTRIRLSLPLARKLGFVGLTIGQDPYKAANYFMVAPYNGRNDHFRVINGRRFSLEIFNFQTEETVAIKLNPPLNDLSDNDLLWEFTNRDVEYWVATHFSRELYINKKYRPMIFEMRDKLEKIGDETSLGPGIDIVDLRDRFYVTMSLGASLRFSLPMAHMFGFLGDNFALRSQ